MVVLNGGGARLPSVYVYGPHPREGCPIKRVAPNVQIMLRFSCPEAPTAGAQSQAFLHKAGWEPDAPIFVVNLAAIFLKEFEGPLALKPYSCLLKNVQAAPMDRLHLLFGQYLERLEVANEAFGWHFLLLSFLRRRRPPGRCGADRKRG